MSAAIDRMAAVVLQCGQSARIVACVIRPIPNCAVEVDIYLLTCRLTQRMYRGCTVTSAGWCLYVICMCVYVGQGSRGRSDDVRQLLRRMTTRRRSVRYHPNMQQSQVTLTDSLVFRPSSYVLYSLTDRWVCGLSLIHI